MKKKIAIIYYSKQCRTEAIAKCIHDGINQGGAEGLLYNVDKAKDKTRELEKVDGIVFGSPTYFGSISAELKSFMDKTGAIWSQGLWRNKIAGGFTHSSTLSGDKLSTLQQIATFAYQHGMIWVGIDLKQGEKVVGDLPLNRLGSWIGSMSQSGKEGKEKEGFESDKQTAIYYGKRLAQITNNFTSEFQNK